MCSLPETSVVLGHVVYQEGVATDPGKTDKVAKCPKPTSVLEVQYFLGIVSYYRRFTRDFVSIARPLHRLTKHSREFHWTKECSDAFHFLKSFLISAPILVFPDCSKPFILDIDASLTGIGAVLSKEHDELERVIAYVSQEMLLCDS